MRLLAATLLLAHFGFAAASAAATQYSVEAGKSHLGFTAQQSGGDFDGTFGKFTAQIAFADADLAASHFDVQVDTSSVDTGDDERDTALRTPDLLDVEHFPKAHFVSTRFTRKSAGQYEAAGKLTIRDVTREVVVPFSFATASEGGKSVATLKGAVTLNRLDYGVGQGDWKDTTWVANEVRVKFDLRLAASAAAPADKTAQSRAAVH
jgi:polyisoprenoid-binding protein YceI